MTKLIAQVFKSAGVNGKVSKDTKNPRFKVVNNLLTLEGAVRRNRYIMEIKDNTGKVIDNVSVAIQNGNDVVNRLNESLETLKLLSTAYDNKKLVEEDEEFDNITIDDDDEDGVDTASSLEDGLQMLYDAILEVGEQAESLTDLADDSDAEQQNTIIGLAGELYSCAIDVQEYIDDLVEEEAEDVDESIDRRKVSKDDVDKAIQFLSITEHVLRKNPSMRDINKAIKDIRSELIVRGR